MAGLADTLAWAGDGAAHLRGLMTRMGDDAFTAPSGLPGWSRAHVLSHIARNADGLVDLLDRARSGLPGPAPAGPEQRDIDIDTGAKRSPADIRADVTASSDRLAGAVRVMPERAWSAHVRNAEGRDVPAADIPWIRAREMWIHAVDLDIGASFADLPAPMLSTLITEVTGTLSGRPGCPARRLVATDQKRIWVLGRPDGSGVPSELDGGPGLDGGPELDEVHGPAAGLAAWLVGRSRGRELRTRDGARPPAVPRWI